MSCALRNMAVPSRRPASSLTALRLWMKCLDKPTEGLIHCKESRFPAHISDQSKPHEPRLSHPPESAPERQGDARVEGEWISGMISG